MNRPDFYSTTMLRSFDLAWMWKDALAAMGNLQTFLAGQTTTVVAGFTATPMSPASLGINLTQGLIYQQSVMDATPYPPLASDSTIVQQGGFAAAQSVLLSTAGLSAGQSMWVLVQAQFSQQDVIRPGDPTNGVESFFNTDNPAQPFQGPNNDGASQPTLRQATVAIQVLNGTPATSGSEVPPNPTSGWVPLYLVDLTFAQTAITSDEILVAGPSVGNNVPNNYPGAPFLAGLLNQHHKGIAGQAPQIDLTAEVKNKLPLSNLPASGTIGGLGALRIRSGNPNGNQAGNFNVNGALDLYWDQTNNILYACTVTGTSSTAVWTSIVGGTTQIFAGGTATGTVNAQVVASTSPAGFAKTAGQVVTFTGLNNSGSASLNVDGTGASTIQKNTGSGNVNLTGGELNGFVTVQWTGTIYLLEAGLLGQLATLNIGAGVKNDGAGNLEAALGAGLSFDGSNNIAVTATGVTAGAYTRPKVTVNAEGQATAIASGAVPTYTTLKSGTGLYTTPAGAKRLRVRMPGGGGGSGGAGASGPSGGGVGGTSTFGSTTANGGGGGGFGGTSGAIAAGGGGGTGGTTVTGAEIIRIPGQAGSCGTAPGTFSVGAIGGGTAMAPGGTPQPNSFSPAAPPANGGGGAASVTIASNPSTPSGGGGGGGEYVEFIINSPASSYNFTVGTQGAAGSGSVAGGAGGALGCILVEEFYD